MLVLFGIAPACWGQFVVKASTDYAFPIALVDETDGYTPETEKKYGDTTITYCNITDGNSVSTYTDDADLWKEIGDGTGEFKCVMGAGEFTSAGKRYLVKVVVSGCRTARFWVDTIVGDPSLIATTDDGGPINVGSGQVESVVKAFSVTTPPSIADVYSDAATPADVKTAIEADGSKIDHLWEMTEDDAGVRRLTANALELSPVGEGGFTETDRTNVGAAKTAAEANKALLESATFGLSVLKDWIVSLTPAVIR
jgi:hypothetical protein